MRPRWTSFTRRCPAWRPRPAGPAGSSRGTTTPGPERSVPPRELSSNARAAPWRARGTCRWVPRNSSRFCPLSIDAGSTTWCPASSARTTSASSASSRQLDFATEPAPSLPSWTMRWWSISANPRWASGTRWATSLASTRGENHEFLRRYSDRFGTCSAPVSAAAEGVYEAIHTWARACYVGGGVEPTAVLGGLRRAYFRGPRRCDRGGSLKSLLLGEATRSGVRVLDELPAATRAS